MNFQHTDDRRMLADSLNRFVAEQYAFETRDRIAKSRERQQNNQQLSARDKSLLGLVDSNKRSIEQHFELDSDHPADDWRRGLESLVHELPRPVGVGYGPGTPCHKHQLAVGRPSRPAMARVAATSAGVTHRTTAAGRTCSKRAITGLRTDS